MIEEEDSLVIEGMGMVIDKREVIEVGILIPVVVGNPIMVDIPTKGCILIPVPVKEDIPIKEDIPTKEGILIEEGSPVEGEGIDLNIEQR